MHASTALDGISNGLSFELFNHKPMKTPDVNTVIEQFDALPWEEKELAAGIIRKAYEEAARDAMATRAKKAVRNHKAGNVKKGDLKDLFKDLEG